MKLRYRPLVDIKESPRIVRHQIDDRTLVITVPDRPKGYRCQRCQQLTCVCPPFPRTQ